MSELMRCLMVGIFLLGIVWQEGIAQRALNEEDVAAQAQYFKLGENMEGPGVDLLDQEISQADMIAFGELHNSQQMALFFDALLRVSSKHGFDKLALEVGPNAAEIISKLIANPETARDQLNAFHHQYKSKSNSWAIPFIRGVEDAQFYSTASELGYQLFGIDQEYTLGALPLFDKLFKLLPEGDATQQKLKENAAKAWKGFGKKERNCRSLQDTDINAFFDLFDAKKEQAQTIIGALRTSWEIYCDYEKGEYKQSNSKRVEYMRKNFDAILQSGDRPKVIAKMGSVHMGRVRSSLNLEDVGQLMASRAAESGRKSLHIRYLRRFWQGKDKLDSKDYADSRLWLTVGKRDEWAVIDLRPFREKIRTGELEATNWQIFEIFNYDLMLMAPEDRWVKNNF